MKVLSVRQPMAELLVKGKQRMGYYQRSQYTDYRGLIAIHASTIKPIHAIRKMYPKWNVAGTQDNYLYYDFMGRAVEALWPNLYEVCGPGCDYAPELNTLTTGAIIGTAILKNCRKLYRGPKDGEHYLVDEETNTLDILPYWPLVGDWELGKYVLEFSDAKYLKHPIPAMGKYKIWDYENLEERI